MLMRHRIKRRTLGKEPRRMAKSLIQNINTNAVKVHPIIRPTVVATTSGTEDVLENADTADLCSPNAIVKYVNLRMECGIRDVAPENAGWIEYAVVQFEEQTTDPLVPAAINSITTQTMGELCINLFRGKCLWNGAIGISNELPISADIQIKLPDRYCKQKIGSFLSLFMAFRSSDAAETTTSVRMISSHQYKTYL